MKNNFFRFHYKGNVLLEPLIEPQDSKEYGSKTTGSILAVMATQTIVSWVPDTLLRGTKWPSYEPDLLTYSLHGAESFLSS